MRRFLHVDQILNTQNLNATSSLYYTVKVKRSSSWVTCWSHTQTLHHPHWKSRGFAKPWDALLCGVSEPGVLWLKACQLTSTTASLQIKEAVVVPVSRVLVQLTKLPVDGEDVHVVVLLEVQSQQVQRVVTSLQPLLVLVDFLHLKETITIINISLHTINVLFECHQWLPTDDI